MKKFFALALALVLALSLTVASADELKVIRIGATAAPHAEILESEAVTAKLAELGYKLEVVVYEGYVLENRFRERTACVRVHRALRALRHLLQESDQPC